MIAIMTSKIVICMLPLIREYSGRTNAAYLEYGGSYLVLVGDGVNVCSRVLVQNGRFFYSSDSGAQLHESGRQAFA